MQFNDWLKTASATFVGGALAIGLVAIPTFVWLPREFDEIKGKVDSALSEATAARVAAEEAKSASLSTRQVIDELVVSIAKMDSKAALYFAPKDGSEDMLLSWFGEDSDRFVKLFPPDVLKMIKESGRASDFKYSSFGGVDWVFLDGAKFNEFSSEEQKTIEESLLRSNVRFITE